MKLPWLTEDQKFAIGATIIFIAAAIILSALYANLKAAAELAAQPVGTVELTTVAPA